MNPQWAIDNGTTGLLIAAILALSTAVIALWRRNGVMQGEATTLQKEHTKELQALQEIRISDLKDANDARERLNDQVHQTAATLEQLLQRLEAERWKNGR